MSGETEFYRIAVPAAILLGLSKGRFTGLGSFAMPMLSPVAAPVRAAAIVLPVLIKQDRVSAWAFPILTFAAGVKLISDAVPALFPAGRA